MADLRVNRPAGVMSVHGLVAIEDGSLVLRVRVHDAGVGQDWTGWTVDYASIDTPDGTTALVPVSVSLEADGWVQVEAGPSSGLDEALADSRVYPNGRPALLTVRLLDPSTWPVYLIAPSHITIKQGPGVGT